MRSNVIFSSTFAIVAGVLLSGAKAPTVDDFRAAHKANARVQVVTRKILAANTDICPTTHADFGFFRFEIYPTATASSLAAWREAMGFREDVSGTVVSYINADGPARLAGLRYGDQITAIGGVALVPTTEGRAAVAEAGKAAFEKGHLALSVRRGDAELDLAIAGQQICAANAVIINRKRTNAYANGSNILVTQRMEQLLTSDDELAYMLAHEAAHVFLGHTSTENEADLRNSATQKIMERDADALAVRLMLKAGYTPEAAATAQQRIEKSDTGPITRFVFRDLLGMHGPYLPPKERTAFLIAQAAEARAELEASITAQ